MDLEGPSDRPFGSDRREIRPVGVVELQGFSSRAWELTIDNGGIDLLTDERRSVSSRTRTTSGTRHPTSRFLPNQHQPLLAVEVSMP